MKILANDGISASGVDALEAAGFEVILEKVAQDDLIDFINKERVVGVLVRSATKETECGGLMPEPQTHWKRWSWNG